MKLYREENINLLGQAIEGDNFEDLGQISTKGDISLSQIDFVKRNIVGYNILECGCGSGRLIDKGVIASHYLEPATNKIKILKNKIHKEKLKSEIKQGVIEYIPFDITFHTIFFMNGFFQVRSDMEAFVEVSNKLEIGGRFIFNIENDDSFDIVSGRVLGFRNYIRLLEDFGFSPIELREKEGLICVEKVVTITPQLLRKVQLVPVEKGLYKMLNFYESRDGNLI